MRTVSDRFKAAIGVSHKTATRIGVTVPGGTEVLIGQSSVLPDGKRGPGWSECVVSSSNSSGVRYRADLSIVPAAGFDTYGLVSTPGAVFTIEQGVDYGAGDVELVDFGVYEAAAGGVNILEGDVKLTLVDMWQRVERCRFLSPYAPAAGTRASLIGAAVTAAIPGTSVDALSTGGSFVGPSVWDRDRTQFINDLAKDGSLDAAFDASGAFRIRDEPIIDQSASVWTFKTGPASNVTTADRERPFDRLYNTVVVVPQDDMQTWPRQIVSLSDTTNPRHSSKVGVVPFFYSSPTLTSASAALSAGETILQRVQGTTETLSLGVLGNPALEVGDIVNVAHPASDTDPGFRATHLLDSFRFNCRTGEMSAATRSSSLAALESV